MEASCSSATSSFLIVAELTFSALFPAKKPDASGSAFLMKFSISCLRSFCWRSFIEVEGSARYMEAGLVVGKWKAEIHFLSSTFQTSFHAPRTTILQNKLALVKRECQL